MTPILPLACINGIDASISSWSHSMCNLEDGTQRWYSNVETGIMRIRDGTQILGVAFFQK